MKNRENQAAAQATDRRKRFRVSLFGAFAWLTVLTLVCSHIFVLVQLYHAILEREEFYRRFGMAIVYDPEDVSSGATYFTSGRSRVQVYQPPGRRLVLKYLTDENVRYQPPRPREVIDLSWVKPDSENRFYIEIDLHANEGEGMPEIIVYSETESRRYLVQLPPGHPLADIPNKGMGNFFPEIANSRHMGSMPDVPRHIYRRFDPNWKGLSVWLDNAAETQP